MDGSISHGIQLVCFDIGRVLLRICDDWPHACRVAGVTVPARLAERSKATPPAASALIHRYDTGEIDLETFAREIAPLSGLTPRDVVRLQEHYLLGAYAGVAELIDKLGRAGLRTACLSNTSDLHWRMMHDRRSPHYLPLERMDHCFASHLVKLRKPAEAIYAHVEKQAGVAPQSIVFFDDVEENVEGARRRGWRGCRIDPQPDDPLPQVREFLTSLGVHF